MHYEKQWHIKQSHHSETERAKKKTNPNSDITHAWEIL